MSDEPMPRAPRIPLLDPLLARLATSVRGWRAPRTLPLALTITARRQPEATAVVSGEARLTFGQLARRSARIAAGLAQRGIGAGTAVAALLPNCPEQVLSLLAVARLGAVFVPVDIFYRPQELGRLLRHGRVRALITCQELLPTAQRALQGLDLDALVLTDPDPGQLGLMELEADGDGEEVDACVGPAQRLLLLYTSGSTGPPKCVALSHARAIAIARAWRSELAPLAGARCYTLAPLFRSPALLGVVVAGVVRGIPMIIPPRFEPDRVWQQLAAEQATIFHATPYHFATLANAPGDQRGAPPTLRWVYATGNRLPARVAERFRARFGLDIDERYGTSEAGGICSGGRPLRGVQIKLVPLPGPLPGQLPGQGEELAEIAVRTPSMAREYLGRPDLTREAFRDGWFHTGDLGRFDRLGRLEVVRRRKTLVTVEGKPVYLDAVQQALLAHPRVRQVLVVRGDPGAGEAPLKAIVVLKRDFPVERLLRFCRRRLAEHEVPGTIELRAELPRSYKTMQGRERDYPRWGEV